MSIPVFWVCGLFLNLASAIGFIIARPVLDVTHCFQGFDHASFSRAEKALLQRFAGLASFVAVLSDFLEPEFYL